MKKAMSAIFLGLLLMGCSDRDAVNKEVDSSTPSGEEIQEKDENKDNVANADANEKEDNVADANPNEKEDKVVETSANEKEDKVVDTSANEKEDKVVDSSADKNQDSHDNTNKANDGANNKNEYCPMIECYIVKKGDTLRSIANKFGVTIDELDVWNDLNGSNSIYVGQMLEIAGGTIDPEKGEDNPEYDVAEVVKNVKEYLLSGQLYQVYWDERFLNRIDIEALFSGYLAAGGYPLSPFSFAEYINENAPVIEGWEDLIKASVLENYGYEIIRFEHVYDVYYLGYVEIDGEEVAYVTVNARSGEYHG